MPQADPKSSSGQEQQQTAQTVPYPSPYPQHLEDDTIDLYDLWITLWNRKWLVIAVTVVVALGSIVYAQQLQHIYKVKAVLLPPEAKDIHSMNILGLKNLDKENNTGKNSVLISSKEVFNKFKQNLNSLSLQKKFIQEKDLMKILSPDRTPDTIDQDIYKEFAELIKIVGEEERLTTLSIELHDAEIAAQWVNDLIEFIDKETIAMLLDDLQNSIATQIRDLEYKIGSKRQMAKQRREDQIIRYMEASNIAKKLGILRRVDATNIIQNTQMNVDIRTATTPLYYLGLEALSTEIYTLRTRKSDDPFISGLRDLQEQLALLRSIKFDNEKMSTVNIDQPAYPTKNPIKPNRIMIVQITTVVGFLSAIFLAFFVEFVHNQRKKHSG